jgi:Asp/Glu/hydantoin racemase
LRLAAELDIVGQQKALMSELAADVAVFAERAVEASRERGAAVLDYSEASLGIVEAMLAEASRYSRSMSESSRSSTAEVFGSYVLEVARRNFGGRYFWLEAQGEPVLVYGEPEFHLALTAWSKVRSRLSGDPADNIPFHYAGFAERARAPQPGSRVLVG